MLNGWKKECGGCDKKFVVYLRFDVGGGGGDGGVWYIEW